MGDEQPDIRNPTPRGRGRSGPRRPESGHGEPNLVRILGVGSPVPVSGKRGQRIALIAELQRGYIARDQLRAAGVSDGAIARLIAAGRLVSVHLCDPNRVSRDQVRHEPLLVLAQVAGALARASARAA